MLVLAENAAASKFFGVTKEQALTLMAIAQAEGTHPACALRDYHIISGRPALRSDAMLARFHAAGGTVQWHELTDTLAAATFSHAVGGSVKIEWTPARAIQAGLGGNQMWKKYPRQMLRARVVSEGIRTVYPAVICGFYAPEEVEGFASPATVSAAGPEPVNITPPSPVVNAPATAAQIATLTEHLKNPIAAKVIAAAYDHYGVVDASELTEPQAVKVIDRCAEEIAAAQKPAPTGPTFDWPAEFAEWLAANEDAVNAFLVAKYWLMTGQTWRQLAPEKAKSLMDREVAFAASAKIASRKIT